MTGTDQTNEQSATAVTIEWNQPPFLNTALEDKKNQKLRIICQGMEPCVSCYTHSILIDPILEGLNMQIQILRVCD